LHYSYTTILNYGHVKQDKRNLVSAFPGKLQQVRAQYQKTVCEYISTWTSSHAASIKTVLTVYIADDMF